MGQLPESCYRVLVIDDTPAIHDDFRKALQSGSARPGLSAIRAEVLGLAQAEKLASPTGSPSPLGLDHALQGEEALRKLQVALAEERPYALAFVDMRMPPGWDGLETIEQLWQVDPRLQIVLCTAYSDHPWSEIQRRLGRSDQLLILKKPFDSIEARQMAQALVAKWNRTREAEATRKDLEATIARLEAEIAARAEAEGRLLHESLHDALTGLPNRVLLTDRIDRALNRAKREERYEFGLLFLDLDDFKVVNDSLGHAVGDRLLLEVAARLQNSLRSTDCASRSTDNTASRMGGDEFVILLEGLKRGEDMRFVAERLLETLSAPLQIDGHQLRACASIGAVVGSAEYDSPGDLLRDADTALYRAKRLGKGCISLFDENMRREALVRLRVESDLRRGIERDELFLQYQPIVQLSDGVVVGFEALVRWRHPKHGVVPPNDFIPIAEETGLILHLGEWVLRNAASQVADWRRRGVFHGHFVNINISAKQLRIQEFVDRIQEVFDAHGLTRRDVQLELTESTLMELFGHGPLVLQRMGKGEISLNVDDFGSGLSSLAYLNRLPINAIKIDRPFVRALSGSQTSQSTVRAVIEMGHARKLKLIAEGVETPEQLALLQQLGCDYGQGFYFSRAVDVEMVEQLVRLPTLMQRAG